MYAPPLVQTTAACPWASPLTRCQLTNVWSFLSESQVVELGVPPNLKSVTQDLTRVSITFHNTRSSCTPLGDRQKRQRTAVAASMPLEDASMRLAQSEDGDGAPPATRIAAPSAAPRAVPRAAQKPHCYRCAADRREHRAWLKHGFRLNMMFIDMLIEHDFLVVVVCIGLAASKSRCRKICSARSSP
jgi:hypothetical protein